MSSTRRSTPVAAVAALVLLVPGGVPGAVGTDPTSRPPEAGKPTAASGPAGRAIRFTYEAIYTNLPADRQTIDVWLPLPAISAVQRITDLVIQVPYTGTMDVEPEYGNSVYHFRSGPRGGAPMRATIRFKSVRQEATRFDPARKPAVPPDPPKNLSRYLKDDRLGAIDTETRTLASKITQGRASPHEKARAIYDWIVANFRYDRTGPGWGMGDLKYALGTRKGNSADFAAAFVGLARASSIASRLVTGFKIPPRAAKGGLDEYHCWAEFWLDGFGWVPVDPTEGSARPAARNAYFGWIDADRIQFSVGRDLTLSPPQNADPINFFLYPYSEGDGAPITGNAYRFSWEEAPIEEKKIAPAASSGDAAPGARLP